MKSIALLLKDPENALDLAQSLKDCFTIPDHFNTLSRTAYIAIDHNGRLVAVEYLRSIHAKRWANLGRVTYRCKTNTAVIYSILFDDMADELKEAFAFVGLNLLLKPF